HQFDRGIHVTVRDPVGVEHRRLVRDADVLDQARNDVLVPLAVDELRDAGAIELAGWHGWPRCGNRQFYAPPVNSAFPYVCAPEFPGRRRAVRRWGRGRLARTLACTGESRRQL